MASNVPIILNSQAVFTNNEDSCFMPLYFSEILAEALFPEDVPLGHFHRVLDLRENAIYFLEIITEVPFSDFVTLSRFRRVMDLSVRDIKLFHRACAALSPTSSRKEI